MISNVGLPPFCVPVERWAQMSDLPLLDALCFLKSLSSKGCPVRNTETEMV